MIGIFLDTEANGLDPFIHNIIEIAFKIVDLGNGHEIFSYSSVVFQPKSVWEKSDPESLKINEFTYEMVLKGKEEKKIKDEIINIFNRYNLKRKFSVFICQNPTFDRIFLSKIISTKTQEELTWPYHWLDLASMSWALHISKSKDISTFAGFSKDQIAESLHLPSEQKPHRAMNGVNHLLLCYKHLVGFPNEKQLT
jgi:oligoribonuclease